MKLILGLSVGASGLRASVVRGTTLIWAAQATYDDLDALTRTIAALASERPRGVTRSRVALTAELARVKEVEGLPPLSRHDLADHVRLNSRRYFLQNGIALVTAARFLRPRGSPCRVQMAAAPEPVIEAVLAGLAEAGLTCEAMVPAALLQCGDNADPATVIATAPINPVQLLPTAVLALTGESKRRHLVRWVWTAAVLLAVAGIAAMGRIEREARSARRDLAAMEGRLASAVSVQADLVATEAALTAVRAAKREGIEVTVLLAALARSLPDSAFVSSLRLESGGAVHLVGYAVRTGDVLRALERAGLRSATLEGPVTREPVAGRERERFTITATSVRRGMP